MMEDQEIEKLLQDKADQIEMRPFDEVWQEIAPRIEGEKTRRVVRRKIWIPVAAAALVLVVALSLILPQLIKPNSTTYFVDDLYMKSTTQEEFYSELDKFSIDIIDVVDDEALSYGLYNVNDSVKGIIINLCDDETNATYFSIIKAYTLDVKLNELFHDSDNLTYKTQKGTKVKYKLINKSEEDGAYIYSISLKYKKLNYIIEYTSLTDNVIDFLELYF